MYFIKYQNLHFNILVCFIKISCIFQHTLHVNVIDVRYSVFNFLYCILCHCSHLGRFANIIACMHHTMLEQQSTLLGHAKSSLSQQEKEIFSGLLGFSHSLTYCLTHVFCFHIIGCSQWCFIRFHYLWAILSIFLINKTSRLSSFDKFSKI